jgi:hypothetical protein
MEMGSYIIHLLMKAEIAGKLNFSFEREYKGKKFNAVLVDKDKFSFVFDEIRIADTETKARLQQSELAHRATHLCEKATYLAEALDVIEIDSTAGVVLLRSELSNQDQSEKNVNYFELTLACDRMISVKRYAYNRHTKLKVSQSFCLTTDIAQKFIDQLVETIA